jgi:hypothetical protein
MVNFIVSCGYTWPVPLVGQELLHFRSTGVHPHPSVFSGVRVSRSLVISQFLCLFHGGTCFPWSFDIMKYNTCWTLRYTLKCYKRSLKIPKGQSEFVNRRRTDNTMAKRKVQKDKQQSTKHTHKATDRVTLEYMCYKWPRICSTCRKHFPVLSSFMTYHWVCN